MAKDLDLHEHYATHVGGGTCSSDAIECLTKTRIWQTILICEMMVGAPQGKIALVSKVIALTRGCSKVVLTLVSTLIRLISAQIHHASIWINTRPHFVADMPISCAMLVTSA